MPLFLLPIVLRMIQSMANKNTTDDRTQPWRTKLLTLNQSVSFLLWIALHEKLLYKTLMMLTNVSGFL